jgi:hypothetical protein
MGQPEMDFMLGISPLGVCQLFLNGFKRVEDFMRVNVKFRTYETV